MLLFTANYYLTDVTTRDHGGTECVEKIRVGRDVYEQLRRHPARFLVALGHDAPDVDRVIETLDTFQIVEKHPEETVIARATDSHA